MAGYLFHTGIDQQIRHCVAKDDIYEILKATHDGPCGGNFADKGHVVKCCRWDTIGPPFFMMLRIIFEGVIAVSEWDNLGKQMKCPFNPR